MQYLKKVVNIYNALGKKGLSSLTNNKKTNDLVTFLMKNIKSGDKILEVGCGYGRILNKLLKQNFDCYGIDISKEMIREAKRSKFFNRYFLGDMRQIKFSDNFFDKYLNLWYTFNYLLDEKDQINTLNEAYRVLKKDGGAIIELLYIKNHQSGKFSEEINGVLVENYYHTIKSITGICEKSNISNYKIEIINYSTNPKLFLFFQK
jgi:ubiquinone/menaquinone biosynthesis C-methylase UbiE